MRLGDLVICSYSRYRDDVDVSFSVGFLRVRIGNRGAYEVRRLLGACLGKSTRRIILKAAVNVGFILELRGGSDGAVKLLPAK